MSGPPPIDEIKEAKIKEFREKRLEIIARYESMPWWKKIFHKLRIEHELELHGVYATAWIEERTKYWWGLHPWTLDTAKGED